MPRSSSSVDDIVSLNADDIAIEELETRLELALLNLVPVETSDSCRCYCGELTNCDVFCRRPPIRV